MPDMLNMPTSAESKPASNANEISSFLGLSPNSPTRAATEVPKTFTDDEISQYFQSAIDAVGRASNTQITPYKSPNTDAYIQSLKELRVLHDGNLDDIDVQRQLFENATAEEKKALQDKASADIAMNNANQQKAQGLSDLAYSVMEQMGVGGNADRLADKVGVFHQLNDKSLMLKASVERDAAELRDETGVSFMDDPVRWLGGIFKIPQLTEHVDAGIKEMGVLDNTIAGVKDDINETVSANTAAFEARSKTLPSITAQQTAAANAAAAAVATEKSAKADQELAKQSAAFAGIKFGETLAENSAEHGAAALAQEKAMNEFRAKLQEVVKANSDAEAKLKIVDLMEKMQDRRQIEGMLRLAETSLGYPPGYLTVTGYMRSPDKLRQFYVAQAAGYGGITPGDAYFNYKDAASLGGKPGAGLSPGTAAMLANLHQFVQSLPTTDTKFAQDIQGKNAAERIDIEKNYVNQKVKTWAAYPTTDKEHNPFYEPSPATIALHFQGFATTAEGKLLQPFIQQGVTPPRTEDIVALLAKNAKTIDLAAESISNYYKLATQVRNSITDYQRLGISKPPTAYNWATNISGPLFQGQRIVDLTNPTLVANFLLEKRKADAMAEFIRDNPNTQVP